MLDDFGTGYSSLGYLTRLPIDALKVDRTFVDGSARSPGARITEAIIAMARALSLTVIGEGAETAVQTAELRRLGCDHVQGYYYSRPIGPEAVTAMLLGRPPWVGADHGEIDERFYA